MEAAFDLVGPVSGYDDKPDRSQFPDGIQEMVEEGFPSEFVKDFRDLGIHPGPLAGGKDNHGGDGGQGKHTNQCGLQAKG